MGRRTRSWSEPDENPEPRRYAPAGLEPARGIAQISEERCWPYRSEAGRQMGNAIESIGAAFGDVAQRQAHNRRCHQPRACKTRWYKFDNGRGPACRTR